ncbi:MAG: DNA polymerase III subunit delta [Gammaproteobacteria bacterium]|nr:DNA polymerase III subunit delta [Gammaproteobacteria bacterium]
MLALRTMQGSQITRQLKPVYLLASSEPLLLRDWLDEARQALREAGFEDIQNLQSDAGLDWQELLEEGDMMSLFASKKCRIITIPNGKPGQQGSRVIQSLCENAQADDLYLFVVPSLDRQSRNASWFKAIMAAGEVVELKPVYDNQLVDWLLQRARSKGLVIDAQSAQFLAERTEGNLLAADQELEKLSIRFADRGEIDFATLEDSVAQSARYSHFLLVDACLAGNTARALKILRSLQAEGYATAQLRWALQSSLEQLDQLKQAQRSRSLSDRTWQQLRIWRNKQRLFQSALSRLAATEIERLLQSCATLDRLGKGQQDSDFPDQDWFEIKSLVAGFSGENGNRHEHGGTPGN